MGKDAVKFPGGIFNLKVYKNEREAGIDLLSKIKRFFGIKVILGIPLYEVKPHNKMTNASLAAITGLVGNTGGQNPFNYLALGTSNTAVSAAHTALQAEISTIGLARASATVSRITTAQANDTLSLITTMTVSGSTTINEIGVFNAASVGVMLARALTGAISVISGNVVSLSYTWQAVGN